MNRALATLLAPLLLAATPVSDLDGDGQISLGEYITRIDALFAQADADFDGRLNREEYGQLERILADANGAGRFRLADEDGDNQLSEREWMSTVLSPAEHIQQTANGQLTAFMDDVKDGGSWEASMQRYTDRSERAMARARAITYLPAPEPDDSRTIITAVGAAPPLATSPLAHSPAPDNAENAEFGEVFGIEVGRVPDGGRTAQDYRTTMIYNFLMKDLNGDEVLSLDEWGKLGLFTL